MRPGPSRSTLPILLVGRFGSPDFLVEETHPINSPQLGKDEESGPVKGRPNVEAPQATRKEHESHPARGDQPPQNGPVARRYLGPLVQLKFLAVDALRSPTVRRLHGLENDRVDRQPDNHRRNGTNRPPTDPCPTPNRQNHGGNGRKTRPDAPRVGVPTPCIVAEAKGSRQSCLVVQFGSSPEIHASGCPQGTQTEMMTKAGFPAQAIRPCEWSGWGCPGQAGAQLTLPETRSAGIAANDSVMALIFWITTNPKGACLKNPSHHSGHRFGNIPLRCFW